VETLRITFYGSLAEAIGREEELAVESGASVADVRRKLANLHPAAAPLLERVGVRACVDDRLAGEHDPVPPGAKLAFLPPLSGG
jgi:molybdopterin converting factor small subunit